MLVQIGALNIAGAKSSLPPFCIGTFNPFRPAINEDMRSRKRTPLDVTEANLLLNFTGVIQSSLKSNSVYLSAKRIAYELP